MKRFFWILAVVIGLWLLGSFGGVMFDPARANLWTQSLMWAMLASVILAPVFIFVGTSPEQNQSSTRPTSSQQPFESGENVEVGSESSSAEKEGWPYTSEHTDD